MKDLEAVFRQETNKASERGLVALLNRFIKYLARSNANAVRTVLAVVLGLFSGYLFYEMLHIELIHELVSEQIHLTEHGHPEAWDSREKIIGCIMAAMISWRTSVGPGRKNVPKAFGVLISVSVLSIGRNSLPRSRPAPPRLRAS